MATPSIRPFDAGALYLALDARRSELGLSWKGVADQIWELSSDLNDRRRDHPISPSTLTGMVKKPRTSCQHALFMLRWLGRAPESFLRGASGDGARFALPGQPRPSAPLVSQAALRRHGRQTPPGGVDLPALAVLLGCSANQLTALRTAKFATGMDLAMRIVQWLDRPAAEFVYLATW